MISPIETYRRLKAHGATFHARPDGRVDITLPMGVAVEADIDAALLEHQEVIGGIAICVDLKQPIAWTPAAAIAEVKQAFDRIDARFRDLPEAARQRVDLDARTVVDAAMARVMRAFEHNDMQVLRLCLLEGEGEIVAAMAAAERRHGN